MSNADFTTKTRLVVGNLLDRVLSGIAPEHSAAPARALDLSELEERILLSASPVVAAAEMVEMAPAEAVVEESGLSEASTAASVDAEGSSDQQTTANVSNDPSQAATRELVFLDTSVEDYQQLLDDLWNNDDLSREIEVVLLSNSRDGIDQISEALAERSDLDSIHFVTHGTDRAGQAGLNLADQ